MLRPSYIKSAILAGNELNELNKTGFEIKKENEKEKCKKNSQK